MKADIFFFIAAIGTIVLTVGLSIAIYYLVMFLRKANKISDTVQDGIERLEDKVSDQPWLNFIFKKKRATRKTKE